MAKKKKTEMILEPTEIMGTRKLKACPMDPESQNRLGDEMVEWIRTTQTCVLSDFPLSKLYGPSRFYKIANYNEYFAECLDYARHTIASRLQHGWEDRTIPADYAKLWLPIYDEKYKEYTRERFRQLDEIKQQAASTFNITIPNIPAENKND